MFLRNKRGCIGLTILLLAILVIGSARAAAVHQAASATDLHRYAESPSIVNSVHVTSTTTTAAAAEAGNSHRTINGETKNNGENLKLSLKKDGVLNTNVIKDAEDGVQNVEIRLDDVQKMVLEYLDESLPPADAQQGHNDSDDRVDARALTTDAERSFTRDQLFRRLRKFAERYIHPDISKAVTSSGRVFLFKGFKKFMWPVFIGMQVAKTVLIAMFLPSIIGSLGKMVGKGLSSVSGYGHATEVVDDFEFKDNVPHDDHAAMQAMGMGYNYPVQQDSQPANDNSFANQMYESAATNNALSLYEMGEQKLTYSTNAYNLQEYANHKRTEVLQSKKDDFKVFHDIPASSLLLTSYDPFYSPLLSRLDSVFHQVHLDAGSEPCREKLVCLMYANPAKYMPYSNLVSAQLSRELNELRKPASDNIEILRFFRYMRAAKDGQDGSDCHDIYNKCTKFIDNDGPAMINTYNDINKLVQARKI